MLQILVHSLPGLAAACFELYPEWRGTAFFSDENGDPHPWVPEMDPNLGKRVFAQEFTVEGPTQEIFARRLMIKFMEFSLLMPDGVLHIHTKQSANVRSKMNQFVGSLLLTPPEADFGGDEHLLVWVPRKIFNVKERLRISRSELVLLEVMES